MRKPPVLKDNEILCGACSHGMMQVRTSWMSCNGYCCPSIICEQHDIQFMVDAELEPVTCPFCGKRHSNRSSLKDHILNVCTEFDNTPLTGSPDRE